MTQREDNYLNSIYKWLLYLFFSFHSVPLFGFQIFASPPLSISTSNNLLGVLVLLTGGASYLSSAGVMRM